MYWVQNLKFPPQNCTYFDNFSKFSMELPLVGVHTHARPQGSPWCGEPNKNLEKNLDPPIINPIIREKKKFSNFPPKVKCLKCAQNCLELVCMLIYVPKEAPGVINLTKN